MDNFICPVCGKEMDARGRVGHARTHEAPQAVVEAVAQATVPTQGASSPGLRDISGNKNYQNKPALRMLKMLFPQCDECQTKDKGNGWWYRCETRGHDPYFSKDHYEDRSEDQLGPLSADGSQELLGQVTRRYLIKGAANVRQIPLTGRHNGGQEIRKARGKGCRLPEEMGCTPLCQFINCWTKDINVRSVNFGDYCDVDQATLIAMDVLQIHGEVGHQQTMQEQTARARGAVLTGV